MNTANDRDEVGDLLHQGYAADVDPSFAASLLTRLQEEMRPRATRRWVLAGAIAAGVAILLGAAAILYSLHARQLAPALVKGPTDGVGATVVRGRILKWDAPIAQFLVSQVIRGKVDAPTVYVDLSGDLGAMRKHVREGSAKAAATVPAEAEVSTRAATLFATQLNLAAGADVLVELAPGCGGRRLERRGRILSWGGVAELPPRDRHYDIEGTIINVAGDGFGFGLRPHPGGFLRDEWGMPR